MSYIANSVIEAQDVNFPTRVMELSGVNLDRCYQCLTCTLGCPLVLAMDWTPNQVLRMTQLGLKDKVLQSSAIWFCASCQACAVRCPQEIDIPRVMDVLRQMALEQRATTAATLIPAFHRSFLRSIERRGRQYDLGTLLKIKLKTGDLFSDLRLGWQMLVKRKLAILPPVTAKGIEQVKDIFRRRKTR